MTNEEFKAWFEGFQEGISVTPTLEQWNKIKAKLDLLPKTSVIERVIYDYTPYPSKQVPYWMGLTYGTNTTGDASSLGGSVNQLKGK